MPDISTASQSPQQSLKDLNNLPGLFHKKNRRSNNESISVR